VLTEQFYVLQNQLFLFMVTCSVGRLGSCAFRNLDGFNNFSRGVCRRYSEWSASNSLTKLAYLLLSTDCRTDLGTLPADLAISFRDLAALRRLVFAGAILFRTILRSVQ
jgi:hypothetical protein